MVCGGSERMTRAELMEHLADFVAEIEKQPNDTTYSCVVLGCTRNGKVGKQIYATVAGQSEDGQLMLRTLYSQMVDRDAEDGSQRAKDEVAAAHARAKSD